MPSLPRSHLYPGLYFLQSRALVFGVKYLVHILKARIKNDILSATHNLGSGHLKYFLHEQCYEVISIEHNPQVSNKAFFALF